VRVGFPRRSSAIHDDQRILSVFAELSGNNFFYCGRPETKAPAQYLRPTREDGIQYDNVIN
jgi:hypothetical protein